MINRRFQVYVTQKNKTKSLWFAIKSAFIIIFIIFSVVAICVYVSIEKKKENNFLQQSFYFVYSSKYRKESMLFSEKEALKKFGGACEIYYHKNQYYLLVNVCFFKENAEKMAADIKNEFPNAGVLRITTSKFSRDAKTRVMGCFEVKNALKQIKSNLDGVMKLQSNFALQKIDAGDVISKFVKYKLDLQMISKRLSDANNEVGDLVASYIEMKLLCYDEFFEKFYVQEANRVHLISKMATKLAIIQIKMINNLSI